MARPKLPEIDRKIKVSITLSRSANSKLKSSTNNKSKLIEELIIRYLK